MKSKYFCPGDSFVSGAQVAKWQVLSDLLEENSLPLDQENDTQFMVRKSSEPSNDAVASQTGLTEDMLKVEEEKLSIKRVWWQECISYKWINQLSCKILHI
ncbi:hypothetical protein ACS0TY_029919 [Phlomoides rotata]